MDSFPLISVIMPAYNVEKYIAQAIQSVLDQSYKNFELIIVNDGSTDSTLDIIKKYALTDDRIRVIDQQNQKLGPSRKNGFGVSAGEYIYFMDSDDLIHPEMLSICVDLSQKYDSDILKFNLQLFDDGNKPLVNDYNIESLDVVFYTQKQALITLPPTAPSYFLKRSLVNKVGVGYPAILHEDEIGTYPFFCYAEIIASIDAELYFYRRGIQSITSKKFEARYNDMIRLLGMIIEQSAMYPEFGDEFIYRVYSLLTQFRTQWSEIGEPWVKDGLCKLDDIEQSIDDKLKNNPYCILHQKITSNPLYIDSQNYYYNTPFFRKIYHLLNKIMHR